MNVLSGLRDERSISVLLLASGIVAGLALPPLALLMEPVALHALFLVMVFSLVPFARTEGEILFKIDPTVWRTIAWQLLVLPAIVIATGIVARFPDYVITLMMITACCGSVFASPALAEILNLDRRHALQAMVISTFLMPFALFGFFLVLHSTTAKLDIVTYLGRTLVFLVLPFTFMAFIRPVAIRLSETAAARMRTASRWGVIAALLVFGMGLMPAVSDQLAESPAKVVFFFFLTTTLCVGMLLLTTIVMYRFGLRQALTTGILSGFRNIGLGFALVGEMAGPELAVYAGVSLLPIFVAPMVLRLLTTSWRAVGPTQSAAP